MRDRSPRRRVRDAMAVEPRQAAVADHPDGQARRRPTADGLDTASRSRPASRAAAGSAGLVFTSVADASISAPSATGIDGREDAGRVLTAPPQTSA